MAGMGDTHFEIVFSALPTTSIYAMDLLRAIFFWLRGRKEEWVVRNRPGAKGTEAVRRAEAPRTW